MHPVGPLTPRTYWARRVAVIGGAVVLVVVLLVVIFHRSSGGTDPVGADARTAASTVPQLTGVLASTSSPPSTGSAVPTGTRPSDSVEVSAGASAADVGGTAAPASPSGADPAQAAASQSAADAAAAQAAASQSAAAAQQAASQSAAAAQQAAAQQAAAQQAAAQQAAEAAAAQSAAAAAAAPKTDDQGRLICPDSSIQLTATTGAPSFSVGSQPILGLTVKNVGDQRCVRDLSGPLQVFTVLAADGSRVWSTADCFPGTGTDVRYLAPGEQHQYNIRWSGTTSSPGCSSARVHSPAGSYTLSVVLGSLPPVTVGFTLT